MKRILAGVAFLFFAGMVTATIQVTPSGNTGIIEGRLMRTDLSEGISGAQITLQGPTPILTAEALSALFTPSPALTPDMRQQIDALIASAPPTVTPEVVASAAARMQAQLLGLPTPPAALATASSQPAQVGAQTDANGHFSFRNLAPGRYQIRAQRDGYFAAPAAGTISTGAPTTITSNAAVLDGQPTPEVVMTMVKGGTVSGRVRDPGGQPASGLQVNAFQLTYQNGRAVLQSVNSKTADDRGEYRLFWLPPGEYYIAVTPPRPGPNPRPQDIYARTFFPGAVDGREAQTVTVAEGAEVAAVDLGILPGATRISGRVLGPNGQPVSVGSFYLLPSDPKRLTDSTLNILPNAASNRNDGQFEIGGVLPGIYDLLAYSTDNAGRQIWGRTRINVSSDGSQDITLKIQSGIEVKARVTVDGNPPSFTMAAPTTTTGVAGALLAALANIAGALPTPQSAPATAAVPAQPALVPAPSIRLNWRSMETYISPFESAANQNSTFDPSDIYIFPNVPDGRYYLQVAPLPPNAYIADVQIAGMSVYDSGIDVGSVTGTIEVSINSNGAKIQGSVLDAAKKPFASAIVALVPQQSRRQNVNLYKLSRADAMGNYPFTGVAPGEYKLFAFESVLNNAWMNAEFIENYEAVGQSITVTSDAPTRVELKTIPK